MSVPNRRCALAVFTCQSPEFDALAEGYGSSSNLDLLRRRGVEIKCDTLAESMLSLKTLNPEA
jgi:hypothetical protein